MRPLEVEALLDTGSAVSIINESLFNIPFDPLNEQNNSFMNKSVSFTSASGHTLRPSGKMTLTFILGSDGGAPKFHHDFYLVRDLNPPCIFGHDILRFLKADIICGQDYFKIPQKEDDTLFWKINLIQRILPSDHHITFGLQWNNRPFEEGLHNFAEGEEYYNPPLDTNTDDDDSLYSLDVTQNDIAEHNLQVESDVKKFLSAFPETGSPHQKQRYHSLINELLKPACRSLSIARDPEASQLPYSFKIDVTSTTINPTDNVRPYRLPPLEETAKMEKLNELERLGFIYPIVSQYSHNVLMIKKKSPSGIVEGFRLCIDYRPINSITIRDAYVMPRIDDILPQLRGAQYFAFLDLASGFWQIEVEENSQKYTAFSTSNGGQYAWRRLPFGVRNAPAVFQRTMDTVLKGLVGKSCLVYIDDIAIFGKTIDELLDNLEQVLQRISKYGLRIASKKCGFFVSEFTFLGHRVSRDGIQPDMNKVKTLIDYPPPRTLTQVRKFLGFIGFYRSYIENFSHLAEPINALTRGNKTNYIKWTSEAQSAFESLIAILTQRTLLNFIDLSPSAGPLHIFTDASEFAVAAVITQERDKEFHPIEFYSSAHDVAQRRYGPTEWEALAVVKVVRHIEHYIIHSNATFIYTDCTAVAAFFSRCRMSPNKRLNRWALTLGQHHIVFRHIPGRKNGAADTLSRCSAAALTKFTPVPVEILHAGSLSQPVSASNYVAPVLFPPSASSEPPQRDSTEGPTQFADGIDTLLLEADGSVHSHGLSLNTILEAQHHDDECKSILEMLENPRRGVDKRIINHGARFQQLLSGLLVYQRDDKETKFSFSLPPYLIFIPSGLRASFIKSAHESTLYGAHCGADSLLKKFQQRYFWFSMLKDITLVIKNCETCALRQIGSHSNQVQKFEEFSHPMECPAIDFIGPITPPSNGHSYILTAIDVFTGYQWAVATKNMESLTVVTFLHSIFSTFGSPRSLLSDKARNLNSKLVMDFLNTWNCRKKTTSGYHPQSNGTCERFNQTFIQALSKVTQNVPYTWDISMPDVLFALRNSHSSTRGFTPFSLMFGRDTGRPGDVEIPQLQKNSLFPNSTLDNFNLHLRRSLSQAWKLAAETSRFMKDRSLEQANRNKSTIKFTLGQYVKLKKTPQQTSKLSFTWLGPFVIESILSSGVNYVIREVGTDNAPIAVHADRLATWLPADANDKEMNEILAREDKIIQNSDRSPDDLNGIADDPQNPVEDPAVEGLDHEEVAFEARPRRIISHKTSSDNRHHIFTVEWTDGTTSSTKDTQLSDAALVEAYFSSLAPDGVRRGLRPSPLRETVSLPEQGGENCQSEPRPQREGPIIFKPTETRTILLSPQTEQQAEHATPTTATNSVASTKETINITHKSDMTTPTRRPGLVFSPPQTKTILSANTSDQL